MNDMYKKSVMHGAALHARKTSYRSNSALIAQSKQTSGQWLSGKLRMFAGGLFMAIACSAHIVLLLILLPFRVTRLKATGLFANVAGRILMFISGCPVTVKGKEHLDRRKPAIYVANHTSALDLLVAMWHIPVGTSGVAKKQIAYIPFFGWLYLLSGHLLIDRGNSKKAITDMNKLGELVKQHKLSIFIWPEGTRSRDGRLKDFKKGYIHLARQTGLPVIPFIITGTYQNWQPETHTLRKSPITVDILPPIDTSEWKLREVDSINAEVHQCFEKHLPWDQLPAETA